MKKLIFLAVCTIFTITALSQKADSVKYCEVVTCSKAANTYVNNVFQVNYAFDFGNGEQYTPENPIKDEEGNEIVFKGPSDMMSFMNRKGYDLISTFGFAIRSLGGDRWLTHYSFKKVLHK